MDGRERIDYLIRVLEGNSARSFALKAGIRPDVLSRVRNGRGTPSFYFDRILLAYPEVSREWLYDGKGLPLVSEREKSEVIARLDALEKEIRKLESLIIGMSR